MTPHRVLDEYFEVYGQQADQNNPRSRVKRLLFKAFLNSDKKYMKANLCVTDTMHIKSVLFTNKIWVLNVAQILLVHPVHKKFKDLLKML